MADAARSRPRAAARRTASRRAVGAGDARAERVRRPAPGRSSRRRRCRRSAVCVLTRAGPSPVTLGRLADESRIERVAREVFGFERCARASARRSRPRSPAATRSWSCRPASGKSAIYQIAGLLTPGRDRRRLAADRAAARPGRGARASVAAGGAAQLNSTSPPREREQALAELAEDALEFLFLAPEQLANARRARRARGRRHLAVRRRRGALHLRVGPRLPARVPAPRRGDRGARAPAGARADRDGGAAGARRDRRAARACATPRS